MNGHCHKHILIFYQRRCSKKFYVFKYDLEIGVVNAQHHAESLPDKIEPASAGEKGLSVDDVTLHEIKDFIAQINYHVASLIGVECVKERNEIIFVMIPFHNWRNHRSAA